jgi:predicted PurR-regulated permease PerM
MTGETGANMTDLTKIRAEDQFIRNAVEAAIRIGILLVLILWCFDIVKPFITIVLWGVIIAIAISPGYESLQARMGERRGLAAVTLTLLLLLVIMVPASMFTGTIVDGARQTAEVLRTGQLAIPPPPESVAGWPLIGKKLAAFWALASSNLTEALEKVQPQIKEVSRWLLGAAAGAGVGLIKFVASIIVAGVLLPGGGKSARASERFFRRLAGEGGAAFGQLATSTVRSVARGILGVALIQSTLAGIGLIAVGVPAAGLLTIVVLMLCIIQLGPGLIMIPTAIWLFAAGDSQLTAILFTIYMIPVILVDNFLKPILLGRGVDVPMLVIFLGAIGGFISMGIIGLFVGSIVLVVGYTMMMEWLKNDGAVEQAPQSATTPE